MVSMKDFIDAMILFPPIFKDVAILAVILSLIQISPLKLDPWTWLKSFGNIPNQIGDLEKRIEKMEKRLNDIDELVKQVEELRKKTENLDTEYHHDKAYGWRAVILSRADKIRRKEQLSRDRWDDTIDTIDNYKRYCQEQEKLSNSKFINGKAKASIELLETQYPIVLANNDFLE